MGVGVDRAGLFWDLVRSQTELWNAVDERVRRDTGVPLAWLEPLQVLDRTVGCRVGDVASALVITHGGASKLIDRLEAAGHCRRQPDGRDRRSSVLVLTGSGRRLLELGTAAQDAALRERLEGAVPAASLEQMGRTLRSLRTHHRHLQERSAS